MQCIAMVAKYVALTATQRFIVSKALSERYVYTSDHDTLCIVFKTTTYPRDLSNIATLAYGVFRVLEFISSVTFRHKYILVF